MEIEKFFNSKDMAEYVKETGYPLTLQDMAWIIDRSQNTTLEEKTAAWQELIKTMPDCSADERLRRVHIITFHQFLEAYIKVKEKLSEDFYHSYSCVYTYNFFDDQRGERDAPAPDWFSVDEKEYFQDPELCFNHYRTYAQADAAGHAGTVGFVKHLIASEDGKYHLDMHLTLEMTPDLKVINARDYGTLKGQDFVVENGFSGMKLSLPTPFKNGDILTDPSMHRPEFSYPFVLEKDGGKDELTTNEECRFVHVSGDEETPHLAGLWNTLSADVEKAREPLQGRYRILKPFSSFSRTDPESGKRMLDTELTLGAFHLLLREEMNQAELEKLKKEYTKEELEAVGLEG